MGTVAEVQSVLSLAWLICGTRLWEHCSMVSPFVSVGRGTWYHSATPRAMVMNPSLPFHVLPEHVASG